MTTPKFNSKSPTIKRILRESQELSNSPSPDLHAVPLESNLFEWHFTLRGPPNSAFASGIYHGRIVLPPTYPLRPPSFRFLTPSGRFEVNREICLSISGHHEETWQPAWGVRTALVALRSFMETDVKGQLGGLESNDQVRRRLADESRTWTCPGGCNGGKSNQEIMKECEEAARELDGKGGEGASKAKREEEKVPDELKLGWRDEMEKKGKNAKGGTGGTGDSKEEDEEESARLAEGFVRTGNPEGSSSGGGGGGTTTIARPPVGVTEGASGSQTAQPAPALLSPLAAQLQLQMQLQQQQQLQRLQLAQRRRISNDHDVWLDRAIVAVAVLLAAAVAKVMLG
ncbi:ubiquitin-conjugating enzyme E2 J1 [Cladorrhinum samala]|uniref:Ubiquitin-conjugating enzyme E2 J1 n=1 Tax=Cladorrhinum samala TaxID=585594 RepID=A0AAV9HLA4_9PEZI|nr:ubiquitin-conjugating enzyme E2 J1 [Cladorrhinum samala]